MTRVWMLTPCIALACGSSLPHPTYTAQSAEALQVVSYPPPPARVEEIPARPVEGAVWIDGEWLWKARRWSWLPGRWVKPEPGMTYSPWVVVRGADGTVYLAPGVWKDASGQKVADPPPLAVATIEAAEVVDAAGKIVETGPTVREDVAPAAARTERAK